MKISYNWLKEYITIDLPAAEVSAILTDIGLEVEEIKEYNGTGNGLKGLVTGHVTHVEKHPDADRLRVTKVDIGTGEILQIVCGAPNVDIGQKVVVAMVGTTLYPLKGESFQIKKAKIRGVESNGMICAEDEIGIGESHDGIIVLSADAIPGTLVKDVYGVKEDLIFEIGLTPNRADAMGHIGVARDLRAALMIRKGVEVLYHVPAAPKPDLPKSSKDIKVVIENDKACIRYSGILLEGITVKESPAWLQSRLKSVGMRPINNVVDVTNFILSEYGQPLHAFDADKIKGNTVVVRNLPAGTVFKTLDNVERNLDINDLMICDETEGLCIAGVFGGINSGVTETTTNIFIECACFDAITIRKTATRHNLRTDAAQKFEKGTDPNHTVHVLLRAVQLLLEVAGGNAASKVIDVYPAPVKDFPVQVSCAHINKLIGHDIDRETIKKILYLLEIKVEKEEEDILHLQVPPFKVDVKREADIVEEVLRIYGLNNIPFPDHLRSSLSFSNRPDKEKINNTVASILTGAGFYEIFNNSITHSQYAKDEKGAVRLLNSLNAGLDSMRTNMLYTGLEAISYNINRRNLDLKFYELGKTYHRKVEDPKDVKDFVETEHLALYLTGNVQEESWLVKGRKQADIYLLKTFTENVLRKLGIAYDDVEDYSAYQDRNSNDALVSFGPSGALKSSKKSDASDFPSANIPYASDAPVAENIIPSNHFPYEYGLVYKNAGEVLATIGKVMNVELKPFDIKQDVYFADLNWTLLLAEADKIQVQHKAVSRFPGIRRDLALVLDKSVQYSEVEKIAWKEVKNTLKSVYLFDKYEDVKLGNNKKSYAVSYLFEDDSRTLTDADIDKIMENLMALYKEKLNAEIRQ